MSGFPVLDVPPYEGPLLPVAIYALVDPRDRTVRYVGATVNPSARLQAHVSPSSTENRAKAAWVAELAALGLQPEMVVLDRAAIDDGDRPEGEWVRRFQAKGALLNGKLKRRTHRTDKYLHERDWRRFSIVFQDRALRARLEAAASAEHEDLNTFLMKAGFERMRAERKKRGAT